MALNTEKQIKSIFYNNTEIPLVSGSSSSSGETATVKVFGDGGLERVCALMYQTLNNKVIYNVEHDTTEEFTLSDVLLNGIICFFDNPMDSPFYLAFDLTKSYGIEPMEASNSMSNTEDPGDRMFRVTGKQAYLRFKLLNN